MQKRTMVCMNKTRGILKNQVKKQKGAIRQ